jgi:hypothetical protein
MTDPESIESYLDCLSRVLGISKGAKDRLLEEVEDHLREAAEEAVSSGVPRAVAERQAVSRFGSFATIANRAALAEAVARSTRRIHRAFVRSAVFAFLAILIAATQLAQGGTSSPVEIGLFLAAFGWILRMAWYARVSRWGLSPQPSLEATLDRQARAWLRVVRSLRYQLVLLASLWIVWWPLMFHAHQHEYETQPWHAAVVFGGALLLWGVIWLRNRVMRARAEKELASLTA